MLKSVYIFFFLIFFGTVQAQEEKYDYYDTVSTQQLPEDSADIEADDGYFLTDAELEMIVLDTSLFDNDLIISPDSVQKWKTAKSFDYIYYLDSLLKEKKNKEKKVTTQPLPRKQIGNIFSLQIVKIVFWTAAGLFVLFILYKLFLTESILKKTSQSNKIPSPETSREDIAGPKDFNAMIQQASGSGQYRIAVRYHYLNTLYKLADGKIIEMAPDKTNYQYVKEINNPSYKNSFASLTLIYEYVWYGEFSIDENIYCKINDQFFSFNKAIQISN